MVCTKYLIRCSLQCHHTFIHKDHTVRDIFCEFHLMSHDHHGDIQIRQRFDDFQYLTGQFRIQCGSRLIKEQDLRIQCQGSCDSHTLTLSAG